MKPKNVISHFGSVTKAAAALDLTPQTINRWVKESSIPLNSQKAIAWDTEGALKPDVKDVK